MSLLGNLYMRISSKKVYGRVEELMSPIQVAQKAQQKTSLHALVMATESLSGRFQDRMQNLLVADAIDDIVDVLQKV